MLKNIFEFLNISDLPASDKDTLSRALSDHFEDVVLWTLLSSLSPDELENLKKVAQKGSETEFFETIFALAQKTPDLSKNIAFGLSADLDAMKR